MDTLRIFVSKKDRRKIENFSRDLLKDFHEAMYDDDKICSIEEQIAKLQENMKMIDSRIVFPKPDKSIVENTMSVVNNVSELMEDSKLHSKLLNYRENSMLKNLRIEKDSEEGDADQDTLQAANLIKQPKSTTALAFAENSEFQSNKSIVGKVRFEAKSAVGGKVKNTSSKAKLEKEKSSPGDEDKSYQRNKIPQIHLKQTPVESMHYF